MKYLSILPLLFAGMVSGQNAGNAVKESDAHLQALSPSASFISQTQPGQPDIYVMIDGKESSRERLNALDPSAIKAITVLKEEMALKKYGEKARLGALEITLKEGFEFKFQQAE